MGQRLAHPIEPVWDENSRILILGSFPSVRSREQGFFYGHPQNRFWKVLAAVYGTPVPATVPEKKRLLLSRGLALWDTVESCEITGSSDASIRSVQPNDVGRILDRCRIERILCNGKTAYLYYQKLIFPSARREAVCLPSTSPANASWSPERLAGEWGKYLRDVPPDPGLDLESTL